MKHESLKARWQRAIDELTARAMQGSLPDCCAWIQHTSLAWLIKGSQQEAEDEEEARWIQLWIEEEARSHGGEALATTVRREHEHNHDHIPLLPTQLEDDDSDFEDTTVHPTAPPSTPAQPALAPTPPTPEQPTTPAVRPIQVGEWLRKVITRRILDTDKATTSKKLLQSRQWGIGVTGGAEAIAITHLLIEDLWNLNLLTRPLAAIQVDHKIASANSNTSALTKP